MDEFIEEHRAELRSSIEKHLNHVPASASCNCPKSRTEHNHHHDHNLDDEAFRQWILNDEGLYRWARSEGVRI